MAITNTPAYAQIPRHYALIYSTASTSLTAPTAPGLLAVSGPDGSLVTGLSVVPYASVATQNQLQFFSSPDGGTTFNLLGVTMTVQPTGTVSIATQIPITNITKSDATLLSDTNPIRLTGVSGFKTSWPSQSTLTPTALYYDGGVSGGTANAQTMPYCYNSTSTLLSANPATGTIVDFTATLTNTAGTTVAPGLQAAATIVRAGSGSALSAGDITKGFTYRMFFISSSGNWNLLLTERIYVAQGQAQGNVFNAWMIDG